MQRLALRLARLPVSAGKALLRLVGRLFKLAALAAAISAVILVLDTLLLGGKEHPRDD